MSDQTYRGFTITNICPPIPIRCYDFEFHPENFDDDGTDGYAYPELHGHGETLEIAKAQIDELLANLDNCEVCSGRGWIAWSCCGDDISLNDFDNCPTCYEHCVTDEGDDCEDCHGTGRQIDNL